MDQGSQEKDQSPEVLEVGQMAGAQGWDLGGGQHPYDIPPKGTTAAGPGLWKECLVQVGTAGGANLETAGRCWTVPGSFSLHCSLPEIYF